MEDQAAYQVADRMEDRDIEALKAEIRRVMDRLDRLQKLHRDQTGRDYRRYHD